MKSPLASSTESFAERLFLRMLRKAPADRAALRALLKAHRLLSLALAQRLAELRDCDDPLQAACAEAQAGALLAHLLREALELLGDRMDKLPERRRPHYTPTQRFRILRLRQLAGLSQEETARLFRVSQGTVVRWEVEANPDSQTVGSTVTPIPPLRRYNDTVHHLAQTLAAIGLKGYKTIAQYLALGGWRVGKTTVARYLKEPRPSDPKPQSLKAPKRAVKARFPHHIWHLDLTPVQGFLRGASFSLAAVLDNFSRMPLAFCLFASPAKTDDICALIDKACAAYGKPRHLIVDKGGEFTAAAFRERIEAWRVSLRYCSAENHRANSRLERFWRSLKQLLHVGPFSKPLTFGELDRDVHLALTHYAYFRPHQGLGGATPAEIYFGVEPAHRCAVQPPRGRRGDPPVASPARIDFLEGDHRFPILRKVA
jgi:transposase InsO family protein/DNA-binding transcriptional regulator YiaG